MNDRHNPSADRAQTHVIRSNKNDKIIYIKRNDPRRINTHIHTFTHYSCWGRFGHIILAMACRAQLLIAAVRLVLMGDIRRSA